mgnify:CR=1 FL=1
METFSMDSDIEHLDIGDQTIVMSLSGGCGSAVALLKAMEKWPDVQIVPVFADTATEDPDLYRFLDDLEEFTKLPIVRLNQGMDIWDCFEHYGIIKYRGACKASLELKIKPIMSYVRENFGADNAVVASGLDFTEPIRQRRMEDRWKPFRVIHPLDIPPLISGCDLHAYVKACGITPPALYDDGYPHNNCGGGCVLAGQGQWAGLLKDFPERFAYHEERERQFFKKTGFSILNTTEKGVTRPLLLSELRERVQAGETFSQFRSTCNCMGLKTDSSKNIVSLGLM